MPLSALLKGVVLDATRDELAPGIDWVDIHRARPRLPLRCPACGAGVHAKVSPTPRGLRYFVHDALGSNCALSGESLAHRLLRVELMHAIRAAGWDARLEVPGDGWRADVLASDAASSRRMAWEAQLSGQTPDETVERTANLHRAGVALCWVTDKRASWLGSAPGVRLQRDDDGLGVVEGHARLDALWCEHRMRCEDFGGGRATVTAGGLHLTRSCYRPSSGTCFEGRFALTAPRSRSGRRSARGCGQRPRTFSSLRS